MIAGVVEGLFPTIDKFSNGVVTSIKSLDTTAPTYQGPGKVVK
jgi:hypothetical protein